MGELIAFFETMPFWYWWVFAVTLLLLEITTGTTYLLWPAAAAALVGLLDMGPMDGMWQWQLGIFGIVTVLLTIFVTPYARDWVHRQPTDHAQLNQRGSQQIGRTVRAQADFADGQGKVKMDDTVWLARLDPEGADQPVAEGDKLTVTAVKGATLIVKAAG